MEQPSILTKNISPYYQSAFIFGMLLLFDLYSIGSKEGGDTIIFAKSIWRNCVAMLLFFILANCILSLGSNANLKYVRDSIFAYMGLAFMGGSLSYFICKTSMDQAGSFRWLFIVLSMVFIIFLAMINTMKFLVELAKRQDSKLRGE
jgi:hypothetical protein